MSQLAVSHAPAGDRTAAPAGYLRSMPWIFVSLGMLAPVFLVTVAALGSDESAVRAQMIVQGCELLAFALLLTVVLSLLYAMATREAELVFGSSDARHWRASEDIALPHAH